MTVEILANGNVIMDQGDSFELTLNGIPDDQNYQVYLAVQDEERNPIGKEIMVESFGVSAVTLFLDGNFTDLFVVNEDKKSQNYYYGVKICSTTDNTEQTLLIGDSKIGDKSVITVYPRKVKGT